MDEEKATLKLRVKPHIPIPHVVARGAQEFVFDPDCADLPEPLAKAYLKAQPEVYEEAVGRPNPAAYTVKSSFKSKTIQDMVDELPEEYKPRVLRYVETLLAKFKTRRKKHEEADEVEAAEKEARRIEREQAKNEI
jgi:hypothetical protein